MGLKIVMITPWGKGVKCGIRTYSENLSKALAELGVDVYIVRWLRFGTRSPELIQSCVIDKIPVDKVDLIHVQHEYGMFSPNLEEPFYSALSQLGKPIVTTMHATGMFVTDRIIAEASKVIVHNEYMAKRFPGQSFVIPHGCKPSSCPPAEECKHALGIDPRAPIVGYLGFISPAKGLEVLIEAMTRVNAGLLIGGGWFVGDETNYTIKLKQWSLEVLPNRCQWIGYVPDERLPVIYGAMDVVVYPSHHITESGALLNALSHGKAVIASNLPPVIEKEKQGALWTFKNVDDLADAINRLLSDSDARHALEQGARNYSEKHRWSKIAKKHKSLYEYCLSNEQ